MSCAGLVPIVALAQQCNLAALGDEHLRLPTDKGAIAAIGEQDWTPIEYTDALYDETTQRWISRAEVAEIAFTAFSSTKATKQVSGRLVVRRIPDLNRTSGDVTRRRHSRINSGRGVVEVDVDSRLNRMREASTEPASR